MSCQVPCSSMALFGLFMRKRKVQIPYPLSPIPSPLSPNFLQQYNCQKKRGAKNQESMSLDKIKYPRMIHVPGHY